MPPRSALLTAVLSTLALAATGQEVQHLVSPATPPRAASPQCNAGLVYDDGVFNDAYSLGNGDPGDATVVTRFDLPAGTVGLDQVCACFSRSAAGSSSIGFEVVVYDDNGPGGQPGTLLGTVAATASSIPLFSDSAFYSVSLAGSGITLPDTGVYVGVRWPGGSNLLCGDRSVTTPQRTAYGSGNGGLSWISMPALFPTAPPRAMGIRVDPAAGTATCIPGPTALCLNGGRFKVEATFLTPGGTSGTAQVVKLTDETGYLWFFGATNVEAVLKVLNACPVNSRFWVFAGGLTNVQTVVKVTDTRNGAQKTYVNPQNTPFQPIQDTAAFATCP